MPATIINIQDIDTQSARIKAVERVYLDLYEAREENSTVRRDLLLHEALFLSAFSEICRRHNKDRNEARKVWGWNSNAYAAMANLSYRQQASELEAALDKYRSICEGIEDDEAEQAVRQAMQEAAE